VAQRIAVIDHGKIVAAGFAAGNENSRTEKKRLFGRRISLADRLTIRDEGCHFRDLDGGQMVRCGAKTPMRAIYAVLWLA